MQDLTLKTIRRVESQARSVDTHHANQLAFTMCDSLHKIVEVLFKLNIVDGDKALLLMVNLYRAKENFYHKLGR